jgi:hypothetical protein
MKTKQEILFEHYDKDPDGGLLIGDASILAAMEDYAHQVAVEFLAWYLQGNPSKFEVERVITEFLNSDYFKELK